MKNQILGGPRTSFAVPRSSPPARGAMGAVGSLRSRPKVLQTRAALEGRASGASEAGALGATKEVLGFIDFLDFKDFLGLFLGFY